MHSVQKELMALTLIPIDSYHLQQHKKHRLIQAFMVVQLSDMNSFMLIDISMILQGIKS